MENKKLFERAEYFIIDHDITAEIIIDGKIKQGAKLLAEFVESEFEKISDEEIRKQFPQITPTNDAERDLNIRNMFKSIGAKWVRDQISK